MNIRKFLHKLINISGYDIIKHTESCSKLFDLERASIREVNLNGITARFLVADNQDAIQSYHAKGKFYEEDLLEVMSHNFSDGRCFVDIGANVGNHLIYMGLTFESARLIAFEPMRLQHSILVINVLLNNLEGRVEIHKVAASDHEGVAQMITPYAQNLGRSMIVDAGYGEWVRLMKADYLLADKSVDFIKIDVEGHEIRALDGLKQTVARCRPIMLIEVADQNLDNFQNWLDLHDYTISETFRHHSENSEILVRPR